MVMVLLIRFELLVLEPLRLHVAQALHLVFLDRVATHILAFEGNSQVYFFEGSYSEYEENKMKRLGNVEPKRFKYKKLKAD